ncbi:hypothetical protein ACPPVU_08955 [Mucilaginibacter sp. McL0603]|uniref:hypothetical protein n=1 Tax=Mucilaginibacter sp. McL0603 TaxID=3415670 RepID=UPI003CE7C00C
MNRIHCPKCKSGNVTHRSRQKYLFRSAGCLAIILLCCLVADGLRNANVDGVVIIGIFGSLFFSSLSLMFGIYYVVKGIRQKQTNYHCGNCKNAFQTGLILQHLDEEDDILRSIRKQRGSGQ